MGSEGGGEFGFDGELVGGSDFDELDANADAGERVADFGAGANLASRAGETETNFENGAFGKRALGIDEHAASADVGRTNLDGVLGAFVLNSQLTQLLEAGSLAFNSGDLGVVARFHRRRPAATRVSEGDDCPRMGTPEVFAPQRGQKAKA